MQGQAGQFLCFPIFKHVAEGLGEEAGSATLEEAKAHCQDFRCQPPWHQDASGGARCWQPSSGFKPGGSEGATFGAPPGRETWRIKVQKTFREDLLEKQAENSRLRRASL